MEAFLLTCYSNGYVRKRIIAYDIKSETEQFQKQGFDTQDDYFVESEKDRNRFNKMQGRTSYLNEER